MFMLAFCLLQKTFFAIFTALMDMLFMGGFIAIAILLRKAPGQNCSSGRTTTPNPQWIGGVTGRPSIHCKLIVGLFGCAVGLAVLFFLTSIIALIASRSKKTNYDDEHTTSRREKHRDALPVREPVATIPVVNRHSVETDFTKDTEKGSDLGMGREYHHTPARNVVAPAAVGAAGLAAAHHHHHNENQRSVSPLPSGYNTQNVTTGNNNYLNTVPVTTRTVSHGSQNYESGYNSNTTHGIHNDNYGDRYNATELPSAVTPDIYDERSGYQNNSTTGVRLPSSVLNNGTGPVDHNVGGVTGKVYQEHLGNNRT